MTDPLDTASQKQAEELLEQARRARAKTTPGMWMARLSDRLDNTYALYAMDATGQREIIMADGLTLAAPQFICFASTAITTLSDDLTASRETVKELAGHVRALMIIVQSLAGSRMTSAEWRVHTAAREALDKLDQTVAGEGGAEK